MSFGLGDYVESTICPRCGWHLNEEVPVMESFQDWPEHLPPPPPLPKSAVPHPRGVCCSPFEIGQRLYWDLDQADPDMPPLRVMFKELIEIESPHFRYADGAWVQMGEANPKLAEVLVLRSTIYPQHKDLYGDLLDNPLEVPVKSLTAIERWPVMEIE